MFTPEEAIRAKAGMTAAWIAQLAPGQGIDDLFKKASQSLSKDEYFERLHRFNATFEPLFKKLISSVVVGRDNRQNVYDMLRDPDKNPFL